MQELEHPDISRTLLWGYPRNESCLCCHDCGQDPGDYVYEAEPGVFICEECFKDRMYDYVRTNPRELARELRVPWRYLA